MSGDALAQDERDSLPLSGADSAERLAVLGRIAEEYHSCLRAGGSFDVCRHLAAQPQYARDIQRLIATLNALREGTAEAPDSPPPESLIGREFGDYVILREIGRGGMGIVYEAEQRSLQRRVALKILPFTQFLGEQQLQRFNNEAMTAAQLRHPNIVPVFSIGCEQGLHYYAMAFIDGPSLATVIAGGRGAGPSAATGASSRVDAAGASLPAAPPTPRSLPEFGRIPRRCGERYRWAAVVTAAVARALHHAHQAGVVHRDVKPSNLLFDENGKVYLADFGLAQHQHQSTVTRTGDIVGTLRYMSPEQAAGKRHLVGARSDVYSLGVTLYEFVCGRPAFSQAVPGELLAKLLRQEPPRPRRIDPGIPADLETIIIKAISKQPDDRYESAEELAADLERFAGNRPIRARRLSGGEKVARWMWHHRAAFLLASLTAMLLAAVLAASAVSAHLSRVRAERALADLEVAAEDAARVARREEEQRRRAELLLYVADMQAGGRAAAEGDVKRLFEILRRYETDSRDAPRRGVEWWILRGMWTQPSEVVWSGDQPQYTVCSSPAGGSFAVAGKDATVRFFDGASGRLIRSLPTGQVEVNQVAFDPTGARLATAGDDGTICVWQADTGRELQRFQAHDGLCFGVAFTPDGERLFSCGTDGKIRCWQARTGQPAELPIRTHGRAVEAIALSADGRWLLSAGADQVARLWDTSTMKKVYDLKPNRAVVNVVAFADNGLAGFGTDEGAIVVFDPNDPRRIWSAAHFDGVTSLAFSHDGRTVISGDRGGVVRLWDLAEREDRVPDPDRNPCPIALIGEDTIHLCSYRRFAKVQQVSTASLLEQGNVRVVVATPLRLMASAKRHEGRVFSVELAQGAPRFVSVGEAGKLVSWEVEEHRRTIVLGSREEWIRDFACLPDGRLAVVMRDRGVEIFRVADGEQEATLPRGATRPYCLAVSPSGRLLAVGGDGPALEIWDRDRQEFIQRWSFQATGEVSRIAFSPDERSVAVLCWRSKAKIPASEGILRVFDVRGGGKLAEFPAREGGTLAFSQHVGSPLLVYRNAQELMIWRPGAPPQAFASPHGGPINAIAPSPDGALFATASNDRSIVLWNSTGQRLASLVGHRERVGAVCFDPDGRTLLSGSEDGEVRLWSVATARPLFALPRFPSPVRKLAFASPPTHLACLLDDGTVRLLPTGNPHPSAESGQGRSGKRLSASP